MAEQQKKQDEPDYDDVFSEKIGADCDG